MATDAEGVPQPCLQAIVHAADSQADLLQARVWPSGAAWGYQVHRQEEMMPTKPIDFCFRDDANGVWRLLEWQGSCWLYLWKGSDMRWVPLKIVDFETFWERNPGRRAHIMSDWQADLYHAASARWPEPAPVTPADVGLFPEEGK